MASLMATKGSVNFTLPDLVSRIRLSRPLFGLFLGMGGSETLIYFMDFKTRKPTPWDLP